MKNSYNQWEKEQSNKKNGQRTENGSPQKINGKEKWNQSHNKLNATHFSPIKLINKPITWKNHNMVSLGNRY